MFKRSLFLLIAACIAVQSYASVKASAEFYQIKVYHLKDEFQEKRVDQFLEKAYLPALHRAGIDNIGVFKPVKSTGGNADSPDRLIYVFIPYSSFKELEKVNSVLEKDKQYHNDGLDYLQAAYTNPAYVRIETIFLNAFEDSPKHNLPELKGPKKDRIYELRSYESPTEMLHLNKVKMFNAGDEIGIFKRLGFNAVFYGQVIAGSRMPNLMYLTTFENKAARDEHWKAFGGDEAWKKLSAMPEYQNNMNKNDTRFLYPTEYSDF